MLVLYIYIIIVSYCDYTCVFVSFPTSKYGVRIDYALLAPEANCSFVSDPSPVLMVNSDPTMEEVGARADHDHESKTGLTGGLSYTVLYLRRTVSDHNALVLDLQAKR